MTLQDLSAIKNLEIKKVQNPFRMGDFYGFGRVENLTMTNISLKTYDILPRLFFPLYSLTQLNLSHNMLTGISEEVVADLGKLKTLDLSHNPISKILPSFLKFKNLETLIISLNENLFLSQSDINNLPLSLKNLIVFEDQMSSSKVSEVLALLKKTRPNLIVTVKK